MDTKGVEQMLSVLRTTATQASGKDPEAPAVDGAVDFASVLKGSIDKVNSSSSQPHRWQKRWWQVIPARICMR